MRIWGKHYSRCLNCLESCTNLSEWKRSKLSSVFASSFQRGTSWHASLFFNKCKWGRAMSSFFPSPFWKIISPLHDSVFLSLSLSLSSCPVTILLSPANTVACNHGYSYWDKYLAVKIKATRSKLQKPTRSLLLWFNGYPDFCSPDQLPPSYFTTIANTRL